MNSNGTTLSRLVSISIPVMLSGVLAFNAFLVVELINVKVDVAEIRSTKFTNLEGAALADKINERIDNLKIPPDWLKERVNRQDEKLENISKRLYSIEKILTNPDERDQ